MSKESSHDTIKRKRTNNRTRLPASTTNHWLQNAVGLGTKYYLRSPESGVSDYHRGVVNFDYY